MRLTQLDRPYRNIDCHPSPDMRTNWTVVGLAGFPRRRTRRLLFFAFSRFRQKAKIVGCRSRRVSAPLSLHRVEAGVSAWRDNWTDHSLESQFRDADHQLNLQGW
jgi:hypothetical protein